MRQCNERYIDINDCRICYFEWGSRQVDAATILLVHATGFHARCWDQTVAHLGDRHIIAVDLRGHGRSGNSAPFGWDNFGADVATLVEVLDLSGLVAVGHSMGGHALTQALAAVPGRFTRAVLVDPVILDPEIYQDTAHSERFADGEHPVMRRRNEFTDVNAMYENLKGRGSYSTWQDESLLDYCRYGLVANPGGEGFVLACPPYVEASVYMGNSTVDIYELISEVEIKVTVMRAMPIIPDSVEMDYGKSPTFAGLADCFAQGQDMYLPELTHFMPMQNPQLVADVILDDQ